MVDFSFKNAAQNFSPQAYRSIVSKYGDLAHPTHFAVRINLAAGYQALLQDLTFLCENAELPGRSFQTLDARTGAGPQYKTPYLTVYPDVTLTFVCRDFMSEKLFFDDWMEYINPSQTFDYAWRNEYVASIDVFQYTPENMGNASGRPSYQLTLYEAYPVTVTPLPLNWADDGVHRLSIQFVYTLFRRPWDAVQAGDASSPLVPSGQIVNNGSRTGFFRA